jgi:hypothetical protein
VLRIAVNSPAGAFDQGARRSDSAADGLENEVRGKAEREPEQKHPGDENGEVEPTRDSEELLDDIEDRPGSHGEERDRDGLTDPPLADDGAEERRAAADQSEQRKKAPARPPC